MLLGEVLLVNQSIPPLLGLHAFEAAARHGSFTAAAAELYLTPGAIGHRVRTLEAHLGVTLFERLPRSLRLTERGQAYLPAVRDIFTDLAAATSGLFGDNHTGQLTIRTQISYAATWLTPRLPDFYSTFPHIDLRVLTTVWSDVLPPDDVDLDIRQGNGTWPGFRATELHADTAVVICGPALATTQRPITTAADLIAHPRIKVLGFDDLWSKFLALTTPDTPPVKAITVDTSTTAIGLVEQGPFWSIVPERFVRSAVRAGRVFLPLPLAMPMRQKHYLLRPDDATPLSSNAAAFTQWLRTQDLDDTPLRPMSE